MGYLGKRLLSVGALVAIGLGSILSGVAGPSWGPARAATTPLPASGSGSPTPAGLPPPADDTGGIVPGQVVVRFRRELANRDVSPDRAQAILSTSGLKATVQQALLAPGSYVVGVAPGQEAAAAAVLAGNSDVLAADPNLVRHIHAAPVVPNDPLYPLQWGLPRIGAPAAWGVPQAPGILVAVLDTGLDLTHPEFAGRVAQGANFVNPSASPQDDNGHGTHVAGIIAAAGNNGIGGAGLAWRAQILPVKVADGSGNLTSAAWINGISFAIQNHAQVINMSFGGTTFSNTEQNFIDDAWQAGIVLVASAGNSGDSSNPVEYPAAYDNVVSVAATGSDNTRAYYSETNHFVAVAAPGGNARYGNDPPDRFILSTWPQGLNSNYQTGYGREVGTSQAAAFVSGVAALIWGTGPGWTNAAVVTRLEATATDLGPPGRDDQYGFGLINAAAAVANPPGAPTATPVPPPPTVPPSPTAKPPPPTAPPSPTAKPPPPPTTTPSPLPPATATPTIGPGCLYSDVCPSDWYTPFIQDLVRRGAIVGYGDNTFRPLAPITRGQVAKLIVLAAGFDLLTPGGPHFADVPPTDPFYPYIETAYTRGILMGYDDKTFRPYTPVTRGQLAKIVVLARGWPLADPVHASFADVPYGSTFYFYVETAASLQVITGYEDATFRPGLVTTRAEAAKIVDLAVATFRPGFGARPGGRMVAALPRPGGIAAP